MVELNTYTKNMAFKLKYQKRGNKTPFNVDTPMLQNDMTEETWSEQTSDGSIIDPTGGSGAEWLKDDLQSEGYKKRLANEIAMNEGDTSYGRAPNEEELAANPDKSIVNVDAKDGNVIEDRLSRLKNTVWNAPSDYDKEGRYIRYANADNIMKTNAGNRLMPGANINYSKRHFEDGSQEDRMHDLNIHEGAHAITASDYGMLPKTIDLLTRAKGGTNTTDQYGEYDGGELAQPQEVYARYKVAQNFLQNKGIFDAFSGEEFTDKHVEAVNKLMEGVTADNFREKGIPYEVFTFFGDDKKHPHGFNKKLSKKDMKTIFNNVAQETPSGGGFEVTDDFGGSQYIS